jgi:hypothetical protein
MRSWTLHLAIALATLSSTLPARAQDRDTKVREDRKAFLGSREWIYNDFDEGVRAAALADRPLMVVFRCIPCQACQKFDDDVARRDPIVRDMLDQFVCVRIVQANAIDLAHFQYDFDMSFAVVLMNADMTVYGRYGTRSDRPEAEDVTLQGLRRAMEGALRLHRDYAKVKPSLSGKQAKPTKYKTPRDFPSVSGKYGASLNYDGPVARSCLHCHQVREAERLVYRSASKPIPDEVLYPYPDPAVLGLKLDPTAPARVVRVEPDSIADRAGLKPGDELESLDGQPLLSIADLQWVLHNAPATTRLLATVRREGATREATLDLPAAWRRGDVSWRVTSWDLRRMALGGMRLDELTGDQRSASGIEKNGMALKVRHVGEFGAHAVAKKAGFRKDDVIVSYDGLTGRCSESDLFAHALQRRRPGDEVAATVLRDGRRIELKLVLQ